MGVLIEGQWKEKPLLFSDKGGHFIRPDSIFRNWITQSGESGYKAEANRYHLYISYACPWACRTLIFCVLKGLEDCVSFSVVEPVMRSNGWEFGLEENKTADPNLGAKYLYEIYQKSDPNYTGKVTVPVFWDKKTNRIINNESSEIIRILNSEFNAFAQESYDFYPERLREHIDEINKFVYDNINNGVYKCGFAESQEAYEEKVTKLFSALNRVEKILSQTRYLVGNSITEADWRLFTTLIRFDAVYFGHFKCNLYSIESYENLSNYLRELYQITGIKETVNFDHIKKHYYISHKEINPMGIVPKGPYIDYDRPHNRGKIA